MGISVGKRVWLDSLGIYWIREICLRECVSRGKSGYLGP